jgi:uncharacterized protein (TIGR03067 family)
MKLRLFVLLALGLSVAAAPKDDAAKADRDKLQGVWTVVSLEVGGKEVGADETKKFKLEFKGDKVIFTAGDDRHEGTFKLDPTAKPKAIDVMPLDGPDKGKTERGIYAFEGDTLKICGADADKERPKEFTTKEGSGRTLVVLKRAK